MREFAIDNGNISTGALISTITATPIGAGSMIYFTNRFFSGAVLGILSTAIFVVLHMEKYIGCGVFIIYSAFGGVMVSILYDIVTY
jgi:hypothetical protein